ncbi:phage major capsid protein [Streptosporangium sp. G12]
MRRNSRLEELKAQRESIRADIAALAELTEPTEEQASESDALLVQFEHVDEMCRTQEEHEERVSRARATAMDIRSHEGPTSRSSGGHSGGDGLHARARRTVDMAHRSGLLPDHGAERAVELITSGSQMDRDMAARWATATGDPAYLRAFVSLLGDPQRGHMLWSQEEQEAYRAVEFLHADMRALSLTDASGGFLVPLTLDPTVLLTSGGSSNPLRRISRVVQTVTDTWKGVSSAGVTAEWLAEANEAADASPTFGSPEIPVHKGSAWVPYSYEVGMDGYGFARELQKLLLDAADQLMATAYTVGDGIGKPKGIVTALAGTASEINSTGTEALVAADAFALQNALPPRFSANAQWTGHLATINALRQMETTSGALKFPELASGQLLGRPVNENSNMDGAINPAATANNYALIYGDFSQFVIVDRIGTTIELIPNLMGANGRPTGQRGLFMWFRTGSDVVVPNAFRMLDVPTTA